MALSRGWLLKRLVVSPRGLGPLRGLPTAVRRGFSTPAASLPLGAAEAGGSGPSSSSSTTPGFSTTAPTLEPPGGDGEGGVPEGSSEDIGKVRRKLSQHLMTMARIKIENYEIEDADKLLQLAMKASGGVATGDYYQLLSVLRLKQRRVEDAAKARDEMFRLSPELRKNPMSLSNAAWVYMQEGKPEKALELLKDADDMSEPSLDSVYIRSLVLAGMGKVGEAEAQLRRAVLPQGTLVPLLESLQVKLVMLLMEVLVMQEKSKEALPLCEPTIAASRAMHGEENVITLCAREGHAAVLRALGRLQEAFQIIGPVSAKLLALLKDHELTLSALGLRGQVMMDLFIQTQMKAITNKQLINIGQVKDVQRALEDWERMAARIKPDGPEHAEAKSQKSILEALVSYSNKGRTGAPPSPPSPRPGSLQSQPRASVPPSSSSSSSSFPSDLPPPPPLPRSSR
eukprot:RCo029737